MKTRFLSDIKICLKIISFMLIVIILVGCLTPFYANRTGPEYNYQTFQMLDENPDILVFGSSLTEYAFNPNTLYKEYGFTSYNLSAISQRLDTTYYVMDTILKNKQPKIVIISTDYIDDLPYRSSLNKEIISIRDLKGNEKEKWSYLYRHFGLQLMEYIKFYFPVFQFHDDLLKGEIKNQTHDENKVLKKMYQKGYSFLEGVQPIEINQNEKNTKEIQEESYQYTRRIVDQCHEKGIEVIFMTVPNIDAFPYGDSIRKNFPDCGYVDFYDLESEIGLNGKTDFLDYHHLNLTGSTKTTLYVGKFIKNRFSLVDHRKENENNLWDITLPIVEKMGYADYSDDIWSAALEEAGYMKDLEIQ